MASLVILINIGAVWTTGGHWLAIVSLVGAIWSRGIASNFRGDPRNMPIFWTLLCWVCGIIGIVMIIVELNS
jgi:hypothetical protein